MGIIAKQSIKGSIYTYAGAALAFINTGLLMPKFFSVEEVGLVNLLIALTLLFSQFSNLGIPNVNTRIFPFFRNDKKNHNGIMMLGVLITLAGIVISLLIFIVLRSYFMSEDYDSTGMLAESIVYLPILIFFTGFFTFFDSYIKALFDAVIGTFLKDFLVKILNLVLIISYIYNLIDFKDFVFFYVFIYISPFILIVLVLVKRKQLFFRLPDKFLVKKYKKEILKVAGFGIISGFSGVAIVSIDKTMITYFVGLDSMGIYAVCFYFGVLVSLPARPLRKISSIILAEAWKKNNLKDIRTVYRKSISNLLLIGTLLYVGLIINLDNIFIIIPEYEPGRNVIILIGAAYLIEMFSGTSSNIIGSSSYYRVQSYIMLLTIVLVIAANIILIPIFKLTGAALASFVTIAIASLIRFAFLFVKYKLQPYFFKHFLIFGIGALMIGANYLIPKIDYYIIDIMIRSSVISILFILIIYVTKVSDDANKLIGRIISKITGKEIKN